MKKLLVLFALMCGLSAMAEAAVLFPPAGYPCTTGPQSYPSAWQGALYSNAKRTTYREIPRDLRPYTVLGKVTSSAEMKNVLLLCNWGDTTFDALKKEALKKYPDADDIVNVEIVAENFNVFIFYMKTTAVLYGTAIKYKK